MTLRCLGRKKNNAAATGSADARCQGRGARTSRQEAAGILGFRGRTGRAGAAAHSPASKRPIDLPPGAKRWAEPPRRGGWGVGGSRGTGRAQRRRCLPLCPCGGGGPGRQGAASVRVRRRAGGGQERRRQPRARRGQPGEAAFTRPPTAALTGRAARASRADAGGTPRGPDGADGARSMARECSGRRDATPHGGWRGLPGGGSAPWGVGLSGPGAAAP